MTVARAHPSRRRIPSLVGALLVLASLAAGCTLPQEGPGSSDLWLVEIHEVVGLSSLGEPVNLTDRPGYDDQPSFLPDGAALYYVSRRRGDVDAMRLDLATREATLLTGETSERIYSPQALPQGNGFSAVLAGPRGFQRLVRFGGAGSRPEPFADAAGEAVSYYVWIDPSTLAVVGRGAAAELRVVNLDEGSVETLDRGVGRSVQAVPGRRAVSWVSQESPSEWWILEHDLDSGTTVTLARTLQGRVDHAWLPEGALLMALDERIYRFKPGVSEDWELVADYTDRGVGAIGRLAVDPAGSKLVFVAERLR